MSDALAVELPAERLAKAVDVMQTTAHESVLRFGREGLSSSMVDSANVLMVAVDLDAEAFTRVGDGKFPAGINLDKISENLNFGGPEDAAVLEYDEETRKMHIEVGEGYDAEMALIDPDSIRNEPDIPDLELSNEVIVTGRAIKRGIKAADLVSDHVHVRGDVDEGVWFEAQGDTDENRYRFTGDEVRHANVTETATSIFSLDYLKDVKKEIPSDAEVRLRFGDEFPIKLNYAFADGHGSVEHMLAPRIQSR